MVSGGTCPILDLSMDMTHKLLPERTKQWTQEAKSGWCPSKIGPGSASHG